MLGSCVRAFAAGAQILLLVRDDRVRAFPKSYYESVANILTERFGGGTASTRTPAEGRWKKKVSEDDIVVLSGLKEGELVATSNLGSLQQGREVSVR